jgi:hypothetical protein
MASEIMIMQVDAVTPNTGAGPGTITGHQNGQPCEVKAFSETLQRFEAGRTYEFGWYLGKEYQGHQDMLVSKHHAITELSVGSNGAQKPPEATQEAKQPPRQGNPPKQTSTPQGVMTGSSSDRERSIQAQAIIKSVIAMAGTETDVQRWLDCHDRIVKGERVGE